MTKKQQHIKHVCIQTYCPCRLHAAVNLRKMEGGGQTGVENTHSAK